jgi:hypothetical protein
MNEVHRLYREFGAADAAWMNAIRATLTGRPGDLRYTPAAKGEPGTPLRAAHDEFVRTNEAWRRAASARG